MRHTLTVTSTLSQGIFWKGLHVASDVARCHDYEGSSPCGQKILKQCLHSCVAMHINYYISNEDERNVTLAHLYLLYFTNNYGNKIQIICVE